MNKELIMMFRKLLALDTATLPDSISPEDFGKLIEKSAGNLFIKPEDFKNLQKTLSLKDLELKKIQDEKDKNTKGGLSDSEKVISELNEKLASLTTSITEMKSQQDNERLSKQYPDILPELLVGKNSDQIEKIVDRQREISKRLYGDSQHFRKPDFSTEADIDARIETIKTDKSISAETSAIEVMNLERSRGQLSPTTT